ncbi:MAG: pyridoxal phosphate-dependent aminotransferase [Firmicutes bacterium]|nr:pyridoxal phosphate-dependent aminotransferase [Bacillota bacterium]
MKYDFHTRIDRSDAGAAKWEDMYARNPDVSKGVVPLSVADMEFKHPDQLTDGLCEHIRHTVLGYTGPNEAYRRAVVDWMERRHDFHIEEDWIVNTRGVVPAFFNAIRAFTEEGDGVIVMSPVYYPFYNAIKRQDRHIVDCPLIETDGYYTIDYDLFDRLARENKNKILLFCSPHNPVGRVWKRDELEKLSEIVKKNDLILLSDEIHFDLIMPGYTHTVFQTVDEELAERTVTFTAPSKSFNLAGVGISNVIIKNEAMRRRFSDELMKVSASANTAIGYKACEIAYNECEDWLDECIQVIDANQRRVKKFFDEKYPAIKAYLSEGTYLQWVDFRSLNMNKDELEAFMTKKAELFLDEGYYFGKNGEGYERINLAAPSEVIEEALERLDAALKTL